MRKETRIVGGILFFGRKQAISFYFFLVFIFGKTRGAGTWASAIGDQSRCAYKFLVKHCLSNVGEGHLLCSAYFCLVPSFSLNQPLGSKAELIPQEERSCTDFIG